MKPSNLRAVLTAIVLVPLVKDARAADLEPMMSKLLESQNGSGR